MSETRQLAEFLAGLQFSDVPSDVVERAQELALHAWGTQLAGSTLPLARACLRSTTAQSTGGKSSVVNYGVRASAPDAAFVNGVFGHGFEMDDNHAPTSVKGGCVVVPAGLAIGEQQVSNGKEFLLALVAGYEIMTRVAIAVTPVLMQRGHHATGTCGPFGAAVTTAKLLQLDAPAMLHAISIAAAHAGGLVEAPASGRGDLKRIFGGMASANGVRSALLAQAGLTGPSTMLEGERGFCRAYGDSVHLPALTAGLGGDWQLRRISYKRYTQDGFLQPMTEALEKIMRENGVQSDDVEEVRVGASREAQYWVGVIREPADLTSAQFSACFSLALLLAKGGAGFAEYTEENLRNPEVLAATRKIKLEVDDEIEREFQKTRPRGAVVTVTLRSGRRLSERVANSRPMTPDDLEQKFRALAGLVLPDSRVQALVEHSHDLARVPDMSRIASLLTAPQLSH